MPHAAFSPYRLVSVILPLIRVTALPDWCHRAQRSVKYGGAEPKGPYASGCSGVGAGRRAPSMASRTGKAARLITAMLRAVAVRRGQRILYAHAEVDWGGCRRARSGLLERIIGRRLCRSGIPTVWCATRAKRSRSPRAPQRELCREQARLCDYRHFGEPSSRRDRSRFRFTIHPRTASRPQTDLDRFLECWLDGLQVADRRVAGFRR